MHDPDADERAAIREYMGGEPRKVAEREGALGQCAELHTSKHIAGKCRCDEFDRRKG